LAVANAATLNPTGKADSMAFIHAVMEALSTNAKGVAVTPKGEKLRFTNLMSAIVAHEADREAARSAALVSVAALAVEELAVEELAVEELAVEELAVEELAVEELAVEELSPF